MASCSSMFLRFNLYKNTFQQMYKLTNEQKTIEEFQESD
uniref:Uncharacterized protein n=1 Tax=Vibrio sp. 1F_97 TaxID=1652827 RepID=A0A0H3ZU09_9VIBR|nr:hypothetical protein [Vibrio sp. 1F_97]